MSSIRKRTRRRHRIDEGFTLQLTSLLDSLIIIVVFLLKSFGTSSMNIQHSKVIDLPISTMRAISGEGFILAITKEKMFFDNQMILEFVPTPGKARFQVPSSATTKDKRILPLFDVLRQKKANHELLASRSGDKKNMKRWTGDLLVQSDKTVPYQLIRRVMYTAGLAGYKRFRLVVTKITE